MTARTRARRLARGAALGAALLAAAVAALAFALLPPHAPVPAAGVALSGLVLVEPGGARREGVSFVAREGRIASLEAAPTAGASDRYAGRYLLPGLADLHVHHPPASALGQRELFALLFLAHGVTSVRDVGAFDVGLGRHRARIEAGARLGPRVFACGRLLDGDPPGWPGARVVRDAPSAEAAVEALAREGADCVKAYNGLDEASLRAVQQAAAARGLPVVGHVPAAVPVERVERMEVQHLMGLANVWEGATDASVTAYVAHSAAHGLSHTPTLVAFARAAALERYEDVAPDGPARLLPRAFAELVWSPARNPLLLLLSPDGRFGALESRVALMQRAVAQLRAAGVPVYAGTDTMNPFVVPGASLHEELRLLAAAGFGPEGALELATRVAGARLGVPGLGRLAPGAPADALLFRADPTRDLAALDSLEAVVAAGRLVTREALLAAAARQRAHFDGFPYAPLFGVAARAVIRATASP